MILSRAMASSAIRRFSFQSNEKSNPLRLARPQCMAFAVACLVAPGCGRTTIEEPRDGASSLDAESPPTVLSCQDDQLLCSDADRNLCVDPMTHPQHCGDCGIACVDGQSCAQGICQTEKGCDLAQRVSHQELAATTLAAVECADFDGDGWKDLVVTAVNPFVAGTPRIRFGLGGGKLSAPVRVGLPSVSAAGHFGITKGDLDRDGVVDLVMHDTVTDSMSARFGRGDGTFEGLANSDIVPDRCLRRLPEHSRRSTRVGGPFVFDVDRDGFPEVVQQFACDVDTVPEMGRQIAYNDIVAWDVGRGGESGWCGSIINLPLDEDHALLAVADLNNDYATELVMSGKFGEPDLVDGHGYIGVPRNQDYVAYASTDFRLHGRPLHAAVADFDGDARLDLAVVSSDEGSDETGGWLTLFLQDHSEFVQIAPIPLTQIGEYPLRNGTIVGDFGVVTAEVNGDDKPDLVTFNADMSDVTLFLGKGDGTFEVKSARVGQPLGVAFGILPCDLDGNGRDELLVQASSTSIVIAVETLQIVCE
jgi:hypothetical protein